MRNDVAVFFSQLHGQDPIIVRSIAAALIVTWRRHQTIRISCILLTAGLCHICKDLHYVRCYCLDPTKMHRSTLSLLKDPVFWRLH